MWLGGTAAGTVVRLRHDVDDEHAALARLSPDGAEIGVATAPHARGRGLATVAAAEWSEMRSWPAGPTISVR
jgi:hypothetical protein